MKFYFKVFPFKKPTCDRFFEGKNIILNSSAFILISLFSGAIFAQEKPFKTIDLQTAIAQTINMNPELTPFAIKANVYKGYAQQAGVQSRPQIGFSVEDALGTGEQSGFKSAESTLSISWLLDGQLARERMIAAEANGSTVILERDIKTLDLAAQTARYFIQVLANKERLQLAELSLKQANNSLKVVTKQVRVGKSPLVDKLKSQAEVAKRELIVDDLIHEVEASKHQLLAQWQGNPQDKNSKVVGALLSLPALSDFDSLFTQLKRAPSVTLFATKRRIAQSEVELARFETKPLWQFSTGVRRYEATDDFGLVAQISVPLGRASQNEGKIKALRASQNQLEAESLALVHQLHTHLYVLLEQMKHSQHVIDSSTNKVIPLLKQAFEEAEKAYKVGRYSYTEWMNTQQILLQAQLDLVNAYQNAHLNNIEIERLTGASLSTIN